ncbi:MAG TPA: hypothetical protein VFZ51_08240 [Woeseiaceae bacterium]
MTKRTRFILLSPLFLLGFLLFIALGGQIVRLLWNGLLPPLFGFPQITFWQALGLLALCRILFGGCGLRGGPRSQVRRRVADRIADRVAERMAERWEHMTPEERERFRQGMGGRWGVGPSASESKGQ